MISDERHLHFLLPKKNFPILPLSSLYRERDNDHHSAGSPQSLRNIATPIVHYETLVFRCGSPPRGLAAQIGLIISRRGRLWPKARPFLIAGFNVSTWSTRRWLRRPYVGCVCLRVFVKIDGAVPRRGADATIRVSVAAVPSRRTAAQTLHVEITHRATSQTRTRTRRRREVRRGEARRDERGCA